MSDSGVRGRFLRLGSRVSTLVAECMLVSEDKEPVEREELANEVGNLRLQGVSDLEIVKPRAGAAQLGGGRFLHQTQFGVNVCLFFRIREGMPEDC